jgi:hypothetical protein
MKRALAIRTVGLTGFLTLFCGCSVDPPQGQLMCESDADCPPGWICNVSGDGLCYSDESELPPDTDSETGTDTDTDTDTCTHDECELGMALVSGCNDCVSAVCTADGTCCTDTWDYWCLAAVADECGTNCAPGLPACDVTYTAEGIGGYADCGGDTTTCTIAYNSTMNTCTEICEAAGGECYQAYNNATDACDVAWGEPIDCGFDTYAGAVCICSRGCGAGALCTTGTCTAGECI